METLTEKLAKFVVGTKYEDLSGEVSSAAKKFIFDSLGCALGGLKQEDPRIYMRVLRFLGSKEQATIFGTGEKASLTQATLINSLLVRVMDYNDIYWNQDPSHPSDLIPVAFSLGEHLGLDGAEILCAVVLGYEIEMRLCDFAVPGIRERGWHHATLTQLASPFVAGKLLGLDTGELVHAAGISGSSHCTIGAVTAGKLTMMKNTVDPLAAAAGVEAALLAREGYTGPEHVIDGKEGLMEVLGESWDVEAILKGLGEKFRISHCSIKAYPTEALTHSPITATLAIVKERRIGPGDVKSIHIKTISRAADILSDPSKYRPESKETADHSLPYCIAAAVASGKVTPEEFTDEKINDPQVRDLLSLVKVEADPSFEPLFPRKQPSLVSIETRSGERFEKYVEHPKGHPDNPMGEEELIEKFSALASPPLPTERVGRIYELVEGLERMKTLEPLLSALRASQPVS